MSRYSGNRDGLQLITVGMCSMVNSMQFWTLLPVTPAIVNWYFPGLDPRHTGFFSGCYSSVFALGMIFARPLWQLMCSRIGCQSTMLLGLLFSALSMIMFSFCRSFWWSVFARLLSGITCGSALASREVVGKLFSGDNSKSRRNEWIASSSAGRLVAPLLGGVLACPSFACAVISVKSLSDLPLSVPAMMYAFFCVVMATISVVILGVGGKQSEMGEYQQVQLDAEPLDSFDSEHGSQSDKGSASPLHSLTAADLEMAGDSWEELDDGGGVGVGGVRPNRPSTGSSFEEDSYSVVSPSILTKTPKRKVSFNAKVLVKVIGQDELSLSGLRQLGPADAPVGPLLAESGLDSKRGKQAAVDINGVVVDASIWDHTNRKHSSLKKSEHSIRNGQVASTPPRKGTTTRNSVLIEDSDGGISHPGLMPAPLNVVRYSTGSEFSDGDFNAAVFDNAARLLRNKNIMLSCLLHGILALLNSMLLEIFPLWLALPAVFGGFGASAADIGLSFAMSYLLFLFIRFRCASLLTAPTSLKSSLRAGIAVLFSGFVLSSLLCVAFSGSGTPFSGSWILISVMFLYLLSGVQICQAVLNIFTKNACYTHEREMVFSLAQGFVAISKVFGPVLASTIFAAGQTSSLHYPFNETVAWNLMALLTLFSFVMASHFTRKIVRSRREPVVPRYAVTMSQQSSDLFSSKGSPAGLADIDGSIEMATRL